MEQILNVKRKKIKSIWISYSEKEIYINTWTNSIICGLIYVNWDHTKNNWVDSGNNVYAKAFIYIVLKILIDYK